MREFELIIDKALNNGLAPEPTPFNSQFLYKCIGFRCGKIGLEPYKVLENPLPGTLDMYYSWPFPQYITGERYNFLIVRDPIINHVDHVYLVSDDHVTVTHIFDIDELTFGQGTLMEVADFGEYAFMTNGVIMIYWDTVLNDWHEITTSTTIPMMRTVCNFNGQAVGGGVLSVWHDCDESYYCWSKIGQMDFTPDEKNTAGYKRDLYGGTVYHTRKFNDDVVGYSSKGITKIYPVKNPVPSFGFSGLSDIGLLNQGAMAAGEDRHVYVGEDYVLRTISNVGTISYILGVTELGYEEYMRELEGEDIIVSYEPYNKNFYIGNSSKTFLLSQKGLTEIQQHPSAVWRRNGESHLLPDTIDDFQPWITTEEFDFGYKGNKTIFSVETDAIPVVGPEAGIDWLYDLTTWGTDFFKPINNQGIAAIIISGNAFRVSLRFDAIYEIFKIGYIKVRYKMTDLRGIRGVYASGLRGQNAD